MVLRALARGVAWLVVLASLLTVTKIGWSAYGPEPGPTALRHQVTFLEASITDGSANRMQRLFPEGLFFMHALTGLAAASTSSADFQAARSHLRVLDSRDATDVFGGGMVPEHGIFQAGWALTLAVVIAERSHQPDDRADVERRAKVVSTALASSASGFLESYPGQFWPCDTVVAASGLASAQRLMPHKEWLTTLRKWRAATEPAVDSAHGLLPHRVTSSGAPLEGPRGSSQSIIQAFMPDVDLVLDGQLDAGRWQRFREVFVVRKLGLVGVREYPRGTAGPSDVDSGPLIAGVSASASVVALGAARRVGEVSLASAPDREAELLGAPISLGAEKYYAFGLVPVGDAFLAWARSKALVSSSAPIAPEAAHRPFWELFLFLGSLPGLLAVFALRSLRRARMRGLSARAAQNCTGDP